MKNIRFKWNQSKSKLNLQKHGVSFEETQSVFYDDFAIEFFDNDHSGNEDRFILLGMSEKFRILVVCHCHKEEDSIIRIISARKATKKESQFYKR